MSETRHQAIVRRFMAGESMAELSRKFRVKLSTIENHIRQASQRPKLKKLGTDAITVSVLQQTLVQFDPSSPVLVFDPDGVMLEIVDIGRSGCDDPLAVALHVVETEDDDGAPIDLADPVVDARARSALESFADRALKSAVNVFPAWKQMS